MIDELLAAVAGYISGQAIEKPKRTRLYASITLGGIFFSVHLIMMIIDRDTQIDNILVALGISIFLGLFSYIVLSFYKSDSEK